MLITIIIGIYGDTKLFIILQLPITIMDFSLTEEEMTTQNNHTYHCQKHG